MPYYRLVEVVSALAQYDAGGEGEVTGKILQILLF